MASCEMFSRLDMELERERENELSSLSTRPVANRTHQLLPPRGARATPPVSGAAPAAAAGAPGTGSR